jgi:hypothetical protein
LTVGFRPQLVVVLGLSVGIPLTVGFRPQLVVVSGLSVGIPLTVGFRPLRSLRLSRSLFANSSPFHDRILDITKPFTRNFSFFTMEFWLSRSLSHDLFLFSRWNSGYQEAFHTNFFFFHDGILDIKKPFTRYFSFFTMEFWLSRSLSHELFLFSRWNSGYQEAFSTNFSFFS